MQRSEWNRSVSTSSGAVHKPTSDALFPGRMCDSQPTNQPQQQQQQPLLGDGKAQQQLPTCTVALLPGASDSLMRTIWERRMRGSSGGVVSLKVVCTSYGAGAESEMDCCLITSTNHRLRPLSQAPLLTSIKAGSPCHSPPPSYPAPPAPPSTAVPPTSISEGEGEGQPWAAPHCPHPTNTLAPHPTRARFTHPPASRRSA